MAAVTALEPIQHDGEDYAPGDTLALTDEQAQALIAVGAAVAAPEPVKPKKGEPA